MTISLTPLAGVTAASDGSSVAAHVAESDPHTQYQKEAEKGVANGYAGLGADGKVPATQLPAATGSSSITGTTGTTAGTASATGGNATTANNAGGNVAIAGGTNTTNSGAGGNVSIGGGAGGSTAGTGGNVSVAGGAASQGGAAAGDITLTGGTSNGGNGSSLHVGGGTGTNGGESTLQAGSGTNGGTALVQGGTASVANGTAGTATLKGGSGVTNSVGADALVQGGDGASQFSGGQRGGHAIVRGGISLGTAPKGDVVFDTGHGAATPTTAIGGFLKIPTCAGAPTGTPAVLHAGTVPMIFDSTNFNLYVYVSGVWKKTSVFA